MRPLVWHLLLLYMMAFTSAVMSFILLLIAIKNQIVFCLTLSPGFPVGPLAPLPPREAYGYFIWTFHLDISFGHFIWTFHLDISFGQCTFSTHNIITAVTG